MHRFALNATRPRSGVIQGATRRTWHTASRQLSYGSQTPTPTRGRLEDSLPSVSAAPELDQVVLPPQNFSKPTLSSLDFWYRFTKFSLIGLAIISGGTFAALEGTHFWVEHFELVPPSDPDGELARWGWTREAERWTGGARGGTDPALGWKAAHALRSAWAAQHWGTGENVLRTNAIAHSHSANPAVEARLEYAHDFLSVALALAVEREGEGKPLRSETVPELFMRHAATLERIGSKGTLYDARAEYERVWNIQPGTDTDDIARLALKLGDVNARLGAADEARAWWSRALQLVSALDASHSSQEMAAPVPDTRPALPGHLPASPHAQRTLAAALSSLSAHYAQAGLLADAKAVQDAGIALLARPSNMSTSKSSPQDSSEYDTQQNSKSNSGDNHTKTSVSPSHALHMLFLHHRASLLALHHAEVAHVLRASSSSQTLEELTQAAELAERVVQELSSPSSATSSPSFRIHSKLDKAYTISRTLSLPAISLLRDARRTALHAWTLSGVLHENIAASSSSLSSSSPARSLWRKLSPSSSSSSSTGTEASDAELRAALQCYERALAWAGTEPGDSESEPGPGSEMLEGEWRVLWDGYSRTREAVQVRTQAQDRGEGKVELEKGKGEV